MYKNVWSPYKGKTLIARPDDRDEAQENDKYAVGIYKKNELICHTPLEFSSPLYQFFQASAENCINFEVIGKRKHEVGLVVQAKCNTFTRKKDTMVLNEKLARRKKLSKSCLELKHQRKNIYRVFPVYQYQNRIQEIIKLHAVSCHF